MKKIALSLILFLLYFKGFSQSETHTAILVKDYNQNDYYTNLLQKTVVNDVMMDKEVHVYNWDEKNHVISKIESANEIKKPIGFVKYVQMYMRDVTDSPPIQFDKDTTGKTIRVYFRISPKASYYLKTIELKTSQIVDLSHKNFNIENQQNVTNSKSNIITVTDFIKEFGGDPIALKSSNYKAYDEALKKVLEKYSKIIKRNNIDILHSYSSQIRSMIDGNYKTTSNRYFDVIRNKEDSDEKKVKYVTINATTKDSLNKFGYLKMYQILDFGSKKTTKYVDAFGIDSVGLNSTQMKLNLFGNKKNLAEILKDSVKLLMFLNEQDLKNYNRQINNIKDFYNVGTSKSCVFCDMSFENTLFNVPIVNLIERNAPELNVFYEMAKSDKFIDFNSQDLLNKQLGIQYLFSRMNENLIATDIVSGKIIGSNSTASRKVMNSAIVKNIMIETFNKNLEFLSVKDGSKNKIKEVYMYSDFGFIAGEKILVYKLIEEKVGSKIIKRKEEIANGFIMKNISDFVSIFRIQDGEKDFYEAKNANFELVYEYKTN